MPSRDLKRLAGEIAPVEQWFGLPATAVVRSC
jgi:hypothetical protein